MRVKRIACIFSLIWALSLPLALARAEVPKEVKESVLIYPGAKIANVSKNTRGKSYSYDIDLQAEGGKYKDVVSFYKAEAKKRGWKIFNDVDQGYSHILMCHDGRHKIDISVVSGKNRTWVRMSLIRH